MEQSSKNFFANLICSSGVSGFEQPIQKVVREYASSFADDMTTDLHGNLILSINPDAEVRVLLAGHADQIGLIISHIDENGFIYFQTVGVGIPSNWSGKGFRCGPSPARSMELSRANQSIC